ncbi:hypothetical protein N7465_002110 [Penicillium sp. CMV-2018d]|nr:hypothetical protein N7465_002110 [Penicillium sp. CMV-2018d]
MVIVARGGIPLIGWMHASKLGNLTLKTDANVENSPAFRAGPVIASKSFVDMKRTVQRQYKTLRDDRQYKMELILKSANDVVSNDHHDMAILLGDIHKAVEAARKERTNIQMRLVATLFITVHHGSTFLLCQPNEHQTYRRVQKEVAPPPEQPIAPPPEADFVNAPPEANLANVTFYDGRYLYDLQADAYYADEEYTSYAE